MARTELPDLILCDIEMPEISGGDVAAALGANRVTERIPFIHHTSLVSPEEARELDGQIAGRPGVSRRAPLAELVRRRVGRPTQGLGNAAGFV